MELLVFLTDVEYVPEDAGVVEGRTVPAPVPELMFTFLDAHGRSLADNIQNILRFKAQLPLVWGQDITLRASCPVGGVGCVRHGGIVRCAG